MIGTVEPEFEPVREAFARNFSDYGDLGASLCVYVDGRPVVDLVAGTTAPEDATGYDRDTLQLVFSSTKGAASLCAHLLCQDGRLDLDAPVARYWPEFAAAGKETVTIRELLGHRAGLAAFDERIEVADFLAHDPAVQRLAAQAPNWPLGDGHGYHALTFGHLVSELVRRIDGRTLGRFFADEVAGPLGLTFHIGLPPDLEDRVADLRDFVLPPSGALTAAVDAGAIPLPEAPSDGSPMPTMSPTLVAMATKGTLTRRVFSRPYLKIPEFNRHDVREAEVPAANGITNAASLARMYAAMVSDVDGIRLLDVDTVEQARTEVSAGLDRVLLVENRIGAGFFLDSVTTALTSPGAFGHSGMGGSLGFCDPEHRIGFGYAMNQCIAWPGLDPRTQGPIRALARILRTR